MALSVQDTEAIARLVAAAAPGSNPVAALRRQFPALMVSRCDALDLREETPFRTAPAFDLYLVDTSTHCWRVVDDRNDASGVIVASRS